MNITRDSLIALVAGGSVLLFGLILLFILVAPIFSFSIIAIIIAIVLFFLSEQWIAHDAAEFENRFWTLATFVLVFCVVFCPDSPMRFSSDNVGLGWAIIIIISYLVHIYHRHLTRLVLQRVPNIKRVGSLEFGLENRNSAKAKASELEKLLASIDQTWISSSLQSVFFLPKVLYTENQIINIFAEVKKEELNIILSNIPVGQFFYKIKDHRATKQFNREKLLQLLGITRIHELNVASKAIILDGLQIMKLSACSKSPSIAKAVILKTQQDDLRYNNTNNKTKTNNNTYTYTYNYTSELKTLSDSKGTINSMHKLIYQDIRDKKIREEILEHIEKQARFQMANSKLKTKAGKRRLQFSWRKILSDVDDTLYCSGGSYPAGVDKTYPKKELYPGVLAFYRELDLGVNGKEQWDSSLVGNLVFLSARPHVYKDVSENQTFAKLQAFQATRGLYTTPSLLAGSLETGAQYVISEKFEPLATKKLQNFEEYIHLYPEFTCIWIGDNGQGDVRTTEMILNNNDLKRHLDRAYIHQVIPRHKTFATEESTLSNSNSHICYFITYVDAAIDAYHHNLIRAIGLRRIMEEAKKDFNLIASSAWANADRIQSEDDDDWALSSSKTLIKKHKLYLRNEPKKDCRTRELNISITKGNEILSSNGLPPVAKVKYTIRFPLGSVVKTQLGLGIISNFRHVDGFYEVLFQWDETGVKKPCKAYLQGHTLSPAQASTNRETLFARKDVAIKNVLIEPVFLTIPQKVKYDEVSRTRTRTSSGNSTSILSTFSTSPASDSMKEKNKKLNNKDPISNIRGAKAWTAFGVGIIEDYRRINDIVIIRGNNNFTMYVSRSSVVQLTDPLVTKYNPLSSSVIKSKSVLSDDDVPPRLEIIITK